MKNGKINNYWPYVIGFITLPILLSLLLLLPYPPFDSLPCAEIYHLLKPYGLQVFGSKSTMWGYMGVLSAAIGVLLGFVWQEIQRKQRIGSLIKSLKEEVRRNIGQLFTGEVERPFYYEIFEIINKDYSDFIHDHNRMRKLAALYDELRFFQEIVRHWRITNPNDIVTECQLGVCINYIHYFEDEKAHTNYYRFITIPTHDAWMVKRDRAIKVKEDNINKWEKKLNSELKKIFKVDSIDKFQ